MARLILLAGVALLSGCTMATTRMVSGDTAVISADDLSTDSAKAVRKKVLVTAAKLAQAKGYEYFTVVAIRDRSTAGFESARGPIVAPATVGGQWQGVPPDSIPSRSLAGDFTVRFLHTADLPADRDGIYDAADVAAGRLPKKI